MTMMVRQKETCEIIKCRAFIDRSVFLCFLLFLCLEHIFNARDRIAIRTEGC